MMEQAFDVVKMPLRMFISISECLVQVPAPSLPIRLPANEAAGVGSSTWVSLPSLWDTWMGLLVPGFRLAQPQTLQASGE